MDWFSYNRERAQENQSIERFSEAMDWFSYNRERAQEEQ